jgi:DNA helicase-2/ATP-dependent DNA helicase PcrA
MEFSKYQKRIFEDLKSPDNMYIEAVAGSGKTTTLIECARQLNSGLFVAFNKSIQLELSERLKGTKFKARTIHSLGLELLKTYYPDANLKLDNGNVKLKNIIKNFLLDPLDTSWYNLFITPLEEEENITLNGYISLLSKLIEMSISACSNNLTYLFSTYSLPISVFLSEDDYYLVEIFVEKVLDASLKAFRESKVITYQEMLYLPLKLNLKPPVEKVVFIDEAQDLSPLQSNLIKLYTNEDTKVVFVGDPRQSIYLFTGAAPDSINDLAEGYKAKKYPLSICYRCPEDHIKLAKEINSVIEGTNKDGNLKYIEEIEELIELIKEDTDILILSRKNSNLLKLCLRLVFHERVKAFILGKEIVSYLLKYINAFRKSEEITLSSIKNRIDKDLDKCNEGEDQFNFLIDLKKCFEAVYDEWGTELNILKNKKQAYIKFFEESTSTLCGDRDTPDTVCLSSVHKSKGLERKNVAILDYNLFPYYFKGSSPLAFQQEVNLQYVALTRSKENLYLIEKPKKSKGVEKTKDKEVKKVVLKEPIDLKKYNGKRVTFTGKIGKTEWIKSYEDFSKVMINITNLKLNDSPLKISFCKFNKGKSWQSFKTGDTIIFDAKVNYSSSEVRLERPTKIQKL